MAKVLNLTGTPQLLHSKDGDSCLIPTGESKVADKFCVNVPPRVKVLEMKKPLIAKNTATAVIVKSTAPVAKKAIKSSKKSNKIEEGK